VRSEDPTKPRVTLLGIGNVEACDDGVGVEVVRRLERAADDLGARVVLGGMAGMGLVKYFLDSDVLVVVDAIDAEVAPGSVFRFDPDEAGVTQLRSNNIHNMGLPHLVTNARLLGADPRVVVYAVQVGEVGPGDTLTPPVAAAASEVELMVAEELRALLGGPEPAG
jgi:hydrogenase maturation protease